MTTAVPESTFGTPDSGTPEFARLFTHEGLSGLSIEGRPVPRLAMGWAWSEDFTKLHIRLRKGVRSHAGPLTAGIVAEALRAAVLNGKNQAEYWTLSSVTAVEATGENEVTMTVSRPTGALPEDLDLPLAFGPSKAGTGPFRLTSEDDAGSVLERFDQYYRVKPEVERVVIKPYPTLRTAWASLLRGEVDMVTNVPSNAVEFVRSDRVVVASFPRVYQWSIVFNSGRAPFRDPAVRRALNFAVDRQRLLERVFGGRGLPATSPLWPRHWAYDATVNTYSFALDRAREILDATGFPLARTSTRQAPTVRFAFTCLVAANFVTEEQIGIEVQKQLYDLGVEMRFDVVPPAELGQRLRTSDFDAILIPAISGPTFGRPSLFWHSGRKAGGLNVFGYKNDRVDRLFDILRESTDENLIRRAAADLQRVFHEDPPALFLTWDERVRAVSRDFRSLVQPGSDPIRSLWSWNAAENSEPADAP